MKAPRTMEELLKDAHCKSTIEDSADSYIAAVKNEVDNIVEGRIDPDAKADLDDLFASLREHKGAVTASLLASTPHAQSIPTYGVRGEDGLTDAQRKAGVKPKDNRNYPHELKAAEAKEAERIDAENLQRAKNAEALAES